jgi:hypothetical protein
MRSKSFSRFDAGLRSFVRAWFTSALALADALKRANPNTLQAPLVDAGGLGMRMDEIPTTIVEGIAIERCRELLGDEAERLSDEDVAHIGRHAEAFARILIELHLEQRSRVH